MQATQKRPRGRPATGNAKSGAERARLFRQRKKQGSFGAELAREDLIRYVTEINLLTSYEERRLHKQYALGLAYGLRMAGYLDEEQLGKISEWIRAI